MRVFNKKYWPHQVRFGERRSGEVNEQSVVDLERWCYNTLKSKDWRNDGYYFVFKRGKDATLFTLRWS